MAMNEEVKEWIIKTKKSFEKAHHVKEIMFKKLNVQEEEVINWIKELKQKS